MLKLVTLGIVSVDGSKFEAAASKHRSVRYDRAGELGEQLCLEIPALSCGRSRGSITYEIGVQILMKMISGVSGVTGLRRLRLPFAACLVALLLVGCADVPEEAVTLSVTIGKDLEEVHRSHRELAIRYFERSRDDVNRFVDDVYRPAFVHKALTEATYVYEDGGPELTFLSILEAEIGRLNAGEEDADPLSYMHFVVEEAVRTIEQTRLDLLKPIESREQKVLRAIDDAYSNVMNAHAIVTGHLASVRRVQQAQEELLADAGLKDIRSKIIDRTADISDRASDLLTKARTASSSLDDLDKTIEKVQEAWGETIQ